MQAGPANFISDEQIALIQPFIKKHLKKNKGQKAHLLEIPEEVLEGKWKGIILFDPHNGITCYIFNDSQIVGKGAQGQVLKALNLDTKALVAVKVQVSGSMSFEEDVARERRNLEVCERLIGCVNDQSPDHHLEMSYTEYTVMDYYPGDNLLEVLYEINKNAEEDDPFRFISKKNVDIYLQLRLIIQAIEQVMFFHDLKLIHRDIKTANFVLNIHGILDQNVTLKLVDVGSGLLMGTDKPDSTTVGTFGYNDPGLSKSSPYHYGNDYFSLGIVIAEIATTNNYQKAFREMLQEFKRDSKRELSYEEITFLMGDVFYSKEEVTSPRGDHIKIQQAIFNLIKFLMNRPDPATVKEYTQKLRALLVKSQIESRAQGITTTAEMLQEYKRRRRTATTLNTAPLPPHSTSCAAPKCVKITGELEKQEDEATLASPRHKTAEETQTASPRLTKRGDEVHPKKLPGKIVRTSSREAANEDTAIRHVAEGMASLALTDSREDTPLLFSSLLPRLRSDSARTKPAQYPESHSPRDSATDSAESSSSEKKVFHL